MSDPALEVVEFLLTAHVYTDDRSLDENDLPPRYRRVFWGDTDDGEDDGDGDVTGGIDRPLVVTERTARQATGVEHPWEAVSELLFTEKENFSGRISLTQSDMAVDWLVERADRDAHAKPLHARARTPSYARPARGRDATTADGRGRDAAH